jgi:hypothetical protein
MANDHDSEIVARIAALDKKRPGDGTRVVRALYAWGPDITDDAAYWCVVGSVWVGHGELKDRHLWTPLFSADRPRRDKIMKTRDRRKWKGLPDTLRVYRAAPPDEPRGSGWSWTLDPAIADKFAAAWDREVITREVNMRDVLAYFDRRGEREILIFPGRGRGT